MIARERAARFVPAGISRDHHLDGAVRGDRLLWVGDGDVELAPLVAAFEALRVELNTAWLGLVRFELQLAWYPGDGERYVRHRDAAPGSDARRVTAICYLNPAWAPAAGGRLRLHLEPPVEIDPSLGTLVVFRSEHVEHEVLPTWASRFAATAWYYGS